MKPISVEKFTGLQVQPNSFTVTPGALERADNVVFSQDFLITKRRGYAYKAWFQDNLNSIFEYQNQIFALSSSYLVRIDPKEYSIAYSFAGSSKVVVRRVAHGITHADYIAGFATTSETLVSQYAARYAALCAIHQVQTRFDNQVASGNGTRVVVQLTNHGMQTGDQVSAVTGTFGVSLTGAKSISVCGANSYAFLDTATGTGTLSVVFLDAFAFDADGNATSGVNSGASGVSYEHYERLSGAPFAISTTSRTLQSNKNLYFTTDNGLFAIEDAQSAIREAGIPPGLDLDGYLKLNSGSVNANAQCAWRVVFGLKDSNDNLHLGAPSEALLLTNPLTVVASAAIAYASATHVVTGTVLNHGLSTGDQIYLYNVGLSPASVAVPDGSTLFVTGINASAFQFDLDDVSAPATGVSGFSYGTSRTAQIYASIPSEILSTNNLYQIYRCQSTDAATTPEPRYKLLDQKNLSASEVANGFISYTDSLPEELIAGNAELYTNPTQEGELQANARPPLSFDLTLFKNYCFFSDNIQYRLLQLAIVAPKNITSGDTVTIAGSVYQFVGDAASAAVGNSLTTSAATTTSYIEITQTAHGFITGDFVRLISVVGITGIAAGEYAVTQINANVFRIGSGASGSGTATYEGTKKASGNRLVKLSIDSTLVTLAESIDATARALVKAINRNTAATIYAQYTSAITEAPGNMLFTAKELSAVTFAATVSATGAGNAFNPALPTAGTTVSDTQSIEPNELLVSKYLEPEAVPIVNRFPIGSKAARILRIAALRDSLIVMKEDGIFRLNGDSPSNYIVTQLDATVILKATRSVAVLNNSVYALTNQGVVQISDTSVRIISRPIEPLLTAIFQNANLEDFSSAFSYESERLYLLSTIEANSTPTKANTVYCYHYITDTWTVWKGVNVISAAGMVSQADSKAYIITSDDQSVITLERKEQTKIDFTEQDICIPVKVKQIATAAAGNVSATFVVTSYVAHGLRVGDTVTISEADSDLAAVFVSGASAINGVRVVTAVSGLTFSVACTEASIAVAVGVCYWQKGISETSISFATALNSALVVCTTTQPHGFSSGAALTVISVDAAISGAFAGGAADITGYRTVTLINATQFALNASTPAQSVQTATGIVADQRRQKTVVTVLSSTQPQIGDAIVTENRLYVVTAIRVVSLAIYLVTLATDYKSLSNAEAHLHASYSAIVKFAPITGGTGYLKFFPECQVWFRNSSSCSAATILFSTDSQVASPKDAWRSLVGTPPKTFVFGGWGESPWGNFPWGGGSNVSRDFRSGPAVIWRLYVPRKAYMATWIQPQIEHDTAGEPLEIQSISLLSEAVSTKVSK